LTSLLAKITPEALGSMVSPTALAVTMLLLGSRTRPRARTAAYLAGAVLVLLLVAGLELFILVGANGAAPSGESRVRAIINIVLAVALLAIAARNILARRNGTETKERTGRSAQPSLLNALLLGLGMMASNFTTLVLYISAVKDVRDAHAGGLVTAVAVTYLILFAALPIAGPLAGAVLAPAKTERVLAPINTFARDHSAQIGTALAILFAIYLFAKGVAAL
jgi:threonine/homoserine/homoserine lactone efflux protein